MEKLLIIGLWVFSLNINGQIPTEGMVGRWTFSGNTIENSGTGNDGVIYGAQLTKDRCGNINSAYSFDGDDYIECSNNNMGITNSVSISFWYKSTTTGLDVLVSKYSWSEDYGYVAQFDLTGSPEIRGRDGNGVFIESSTDEAPRRDREWHHFVGIVNGSMWTAYIDTVMIASFDNGHSNVDIGSCSLPLIFGRLSEYVGSSWKYYTGTLDDVTIYNRPVSQSEIAQLFLDDCTITSIGQTSTESIKILPNPTTGIVKIEMNEKIESINDIYITDYLGRTLFFDKNSALSNGIIDLGNQKRGVYLLQIKIGEEVVRQRIVLY